MFSKELGRAIKLARNAKGWPLERLADEVGLSVSQLSRFERGERRIHADEIDKIAKALGAPALNASGLPPYIYDRLKNAPPETQGQVLKIIEALLSGP